MAGFGVGDGEGGSRRRLPSWSFTAVDNKDGAGRVAIRPKQNSQLKKSETNKAKNRNRNRNKNKNKNTCRRTKSSPVDEKEIHQDYNVDDDDDGELTLTVQDLLTFAEEYVQVDRNRDISELQSSSNTIKDFQSESGSSNFSNGSNNITIPTSITASATASATSTTSLASASGNDPDPAHCHMLHLFLGPLLNKPSLPDHYKS